MNRTVFAVDIGTSSLKAALISVDGTVLAYSRIRFLPGTRTARDWERAFFTAWETVCASVQPDAICVSGNGPTLVGIMEGKASGLLMWNDRVPDTEYTGRSIFMPRIEAYRKIFSDRYARLSLLLSGPEYLVYLLSGAAVTILPDTRYESAYWTAEDAGLLPDSSVLPPFIPPAVIAGYTRTILADGRSSPLPAGIPVVTGGPDFYTALVGTATLHPAQACDRAGTSEGLNLCTEQPLNCQGIRTLPGVLPGLWNASWLLNETGADFHRYRQESGKSAVSYPELLAEIEASPIIPRNGEQLHPGRYHVEKIGFAVREGIEALKKASAHESEYRLSGGQARNEIWNQMKADMTGTVFVLTGTADGELMGDAVLGFTALGDFRTIEEAASAMVRVSRRYEPDPRRYSLYTEKYDYLRNTGTRDLPHL